MVNSVWPCPELDKIYADVCREEMRTVDLNIIKHVLEETDRRKTMNFGKAIEELKSGSRVQRTGWNGKGLWLELQVPDEGSKMTLPYIYLDYPEDAQNTPGARVPWIASQTDMLSEDWVAVS